MADNVSQIQVAKVTEDTRITADTAPPLQFRLRQVMHHLPVPTKCERGVWGGVATPPQLAYVMGLLGACLET